MLTKMCDSRSSGYPLMNIAEDGIHGVISLNCLVDSWVLWGTDIPRVHQKDKRPHERPKGPIIHKVIPSWSWGGTTSEAD
jgi:hypothetical protein